MKIFKNIPNKISNKINKLTDIEIAENIFDIQSIDQINNYFDI